MVARQKLLLVLWGPEGGMSTVYVVKVFLLGFADESPRRTRRPPGGGCGRLCLVDDENAVMLVLSKGEGYIQLLYHPQPFKHKE